MIAIDTVQNALRSPQPWSALDQLVQAELSVGRLTNQIHDDLTTALDDVRSAPDSSEDLEEPLLDTLDRLTGFCREDQVYRNPPVLPTEDEIAKLPRWARVAFAARCARRVLPLIYAAKSSLNSAQLDALLKAQELSEYAASVGKPIHDYRLVADPTMTAFQLEGPLKHAANACAGSAHLARHYDADNKNPSGVAVAREAVHAMDGGLENIRRDFDLLVRLASAYGWTDDTPVPPEVFGPLWPEGKPAGWPDDPELPKRTDFALEAVSSERVSDTMIEDEVVNLFLAMNRFHIARTGQSLTVEDFQPYLAALVPAGV